MGKAFEFQNKGIKVYLNFASSGDLKKQIEAGAPVDVFASAAQREMDDLERRGGLAAGTRRNLLPTMVLARSSASTVQLSSFNDLARKEIKKIGIGNPPSVPQDVCRAVLKHFGVWKQ